MEPQPNTESAPVAQTPVQSNTPKLEQNLLNLNVETPVTGLNYATLLNRVIATLIDGVAVFIVAFIIGIVILIPFAVVSSATDNSTAFGFGTGIFSLITAVLFILYESFFVSSKYQGTPGKILMKLKVADVRGQRLSFQHALKRTVFKNIFSIIGILPIPYMSFLQFIYLLANMYFIYSDQNKQSLYDKYANTVVINA